MSRLILPPSEKHVLVIGGAGYVGSVLVRKLLDSRFHVRVLDALLYGNEAVIDELTAHPCFTFVHGNFCDQQVLDQALDNVSHVVHLAALVGDPICKKYPDLARRINDTGTISMIDQLKGRGIGRFVFMSTCSNYGLRDTDEEVTEESELSPQSLYAETKVKVERYLLDSGKELDYAPTILRAATAYGLSPRMRFDLTVNEFTRELAAGHELLVYDADTWRPYCHVADIAEAIVGVLETSTEAIRGEVFNVGSPGENYTKRMIVDLLLSHLPAAQVRYRRGKVDPRNYRVSFAKISDRLKFSASIGLPDYLVDLIGAVGAGRFDDYEDRREFYGNYVLAE